MGIEQTIDTATPFLNAFGEPVTYYPKAGGSRSIIAIVHRKAVAGLPGMVGVASYYAEIEVANSAAEGISLTELDTGGDGLGYPPRIGQAAQRRAIRRIISQDCGMMLLEVV